MKKELADYLNNEAEKTKKRMKTQHTPTPWHYNGGKKIYIYSSHRNGAYCAEINTTSDNGDKIRDAEANAAHIVKCVNLHDELVEALDFMISEYSGILECRQGQECLDVLKRAKA